MKDQGEAGGERKGDTETEVDGEVKMEMEPEIEVEADERAVDVCSENEAETKRSGTKTKLEVETKAKASTDANTKRLLNVKGRYVRRFRWGAADAFDPSHCDSAELRGVVFHHIEVCSSFFVPQIC